MTPDLSSERQSLLKAEPHDLARPQRFGIWPTWRFWNRKDVWRTGRWFIVPFLSAELWTILWAFRALPWPTWVELTIVGPIGFGAAALTMGAFERYLRRRAGRG